jgi:hypothetical protein
MVVHMLQVSALDKAPFGAMARDIVLFMDDKSTFRSCKRDGIFYEVSIPYSFGFAQMMSKRHELKKASRYSQQRTHFFAFRASNRGTRRQSGIVRSLALAFSQVVDELQAQGAAGALVAVHSRR